MEKFFKNSLDLQIYKNASKEAKNFVIKTSTNVFVDGELVPLDIALSNEKMNTYLKHRM